MYFMRNESDARNIFTMLFRLNAYVCVCSVSGKNKNKKEIEQLKLTLLNTYIVSLLSSLSVSSIRFDKSIN